jgi:hypothetical protein
MGHQGRASPNGSGWSQRRHCVPGRSRRPCTSVPITAGRGGPERTLTDNTIAAVTWAVRHLPS